jgi:hypothetical protein
MDDVESITKSTGLLDAISGFLLGVRRAIARWTAADPSTQTANSIPGAPDLTLSLRIDHQNWVRAVVEGAGAAQATGTFTPWGAPPVRLRREPAANGLGFERIFPMKGKFTVEVLTHAGERVILASAFDPDRDRVLVARRIGWSAH